MSVLLEKNKPFEQVFRDTIQTKCQSAAHLIRQESGDNLHYVIHEVRKSFKQIRGMLRVVRDGISYYKNENVFFRDQGREISDIRDISSMLEAVELLYEQNEDFIYKNSFSNLKNSLEQDRADKVGKHAYEQKLKKVGEQLESKCSAIPAWETNVALEHIEKGIKRVYKRGRQAGEKARVTQAPADLHEWRKKVKYLRYQLSLIQPVWPKFIDAFEDELHQLSDYLGTDRDLFMLESYIQNKPDSVAPEEREYFVHNLISGQRDQLQQHALILGKKLYELKPNQFAKWITTAITSSQTILANAVVDEAVLQS